VVVLSREHESFDLYSVRIPEANELSSPVSVTNNQVEKMGLGMSALLFASGFCSFC